MKLEETESGQTILNIRPALVKSKPPRVIKQPLTYDEIEEAAFWGVRQRLESIFNGRQEHFTNPGARADYNADINSKYGEKAVAKFLKLEDWQHRINTFTDPDVGPYQVRTALIRRPYPYLNIKERDKSDEIFIACYADRIDEKYVAILGWIHGYEAKLNKWWRNKDVEGWHWVKYPSWFIEWEYLHDMETLPPMKKGGVGNGQKA